MDVLTLQFNADGTLLISGGYDHSIRVWDPARAALIAELRGHSAPILSLSLAPDDRLLASGGHDRTVRLWDIAARRSEGILGAYKHFVRSVAFRPAAAKADRQGAPQLAVGTHLALKKLQSSSS